MKNKKVDHELATPPYFKSWRTIYLIIVVNLLLIITLLYIFSTAFS